METSRPKRLPISTSTFRKIIEGNYLYIDKTKDIYQLVQQGTGAYFLSRPRRFGKSLLISMLEELFQGNRDLFQGLWIAGSDYDWEPHPVIRLDFSLYPAKTKSELQDNIKHYLSFIAKQYDITLTNGPHYAQFHDLIVTLSAKKKVVILIDEYDKPLIDNLEDLERAKAIRDTLKGFYGLIKAMESHIHFAFITGISKFSRVSLFSDLNTLNELTLDARFATMLGITEAELRDYFQDRLPEFAAQENISVEELLACIRQWYNGFRFSRREADVYNPFSIMLLFEKFSFHNYWFESGTPTFLVKRLHQQNYDMQELKDLVVEELAFSTYDIDRLAIVPLLFQTGYLTIKDYNPKKQTYRLDYPNYEVENAFLTYVLDTFSNLEQGLSTSHLWRLIEALQTQDLDRFFTILKVLFANIDYDLQLNYEKYYQTIFYLIFTLIGLRVQAEVKTNAGRIDVVIEVAERIYLFEFKRDKSAAEALQQIKDQAYYQKYQLRGKAITCIGANFNMKTRTVDGWEVEDVAYTQRGHKVNV